MLPAMRRSGSDTPTSKAPPRPRSPVSMYRSYDFGTSKPPRPLVRLEPKPKRANPSRSDAPQETPSTSTSTAPSKTSLTNETGESKRKLWSIPFPRLHGKSKLHVSSPTRFQQTVLAVDGERNSAVGMDPSSVSRLGVEQPPSSVPGDHTHRPDTSPATAAHPHPIHVSHGVTHRSSESTSPLPNKTETAGSVYNDITLVGHHIHVDMDRTETAVEAGLEQTKTAEASESAPTLDSDLPFVNSTVPLARCLYSTPPSTTSADPVSGHLQKDVREHSETNWIGHWNVDEIQDVIQKLRELK